MMQLLLHVVQTLLSSHQGRMERVKRLPSGRVCVFLLQRKNYSRLILIIQAPPKDFWATALGLELGQESRMQRDIMINVSKKIVGSRSRAIPPKGTTWNRTERVQKNTSISECGKTGCY